MNITGIAKVLIKNIWQLLFMPFMGETEQLKRKNLTVTESKSIRLNNERVLSVCLPYKVAKKNQTDNVILFHLDFL